MSGSVRPSSPALRGPASRRRWLGAGWLALGLLIWFAGIGSRALNEPDEGRYAEIARAMFASGDWVMPRFDGFRFYDKPPLQYWITALSYHAFGVGQWTARLWSALAGLLCVGAVWVAAHRVWDARRGRLAALVCGSALLVVVAAHTVTLDMGVSAFLAAALASFLVAQHGSPSPASRRRWLLTTWIAMALAILSKGLIGVVIPGAALAAYMAWQRDPGLLRRLYIVPGLALLLAIAAPWFVLLARRDPTFLPFFFIHEHFGRFLSKVVDRNHPWWYYLPILIVGLLPWTTFVPAAIRKAWRAARDGDGAIRLVLAWSVLVLLFFSVSGAKLPLYVLPLFPAVALLIAAAIVELSPRAVAWRLLPIAVLGVAGATALAWLPHTSVLHGTRALYASLCAPMAWALLALAVGTGLGAALALRDRVDTAIAVAALGGLLFTQGLLLGYQQLAPSTSAQSMAALAQPHLQPGVPVYAVRMFYRGLPFYLQRPVTLVDERPYDMRAGMALDPELSLPDLVAFGREWPRHPGALAFMSRDTFSTLSAQQLPMQEVATVAGTVIVRNPAPASAPAPRRY